MPLIPRRLLQPPSQNDITGARWGIQTAEAILQLRAITANGDWNAYWAWHLHREHERNHPPSYALAA